PLNVTGHSGDHDRTNEFDPFPTFGPAPFGHGTGAKSTNPFTFPIASAKNPTTAPALLIPLMVVPITLPNAGVCTEPAASYWCQSAPSKTKPCTVLSLAVKNPTTLPGSLQPRGERLLTFGIWFALGIRGSVLLKVW